MCEKLIRNSSTTMTTTLTGMESLKWACHILKFYKHPPAGWWRWWWWWKFQKDETPTSVYICVYNVEQQRRLKIHNFVNVKRRSAILRLSNTLSWWWVIFFCSLLCVHAGVWKTSDDFHCWVTGGRNMEQQIFSFFCNIFTSSPATISSSHHIDIFSRIPPNART